MNKGIIYSISISSERGQLKKRSLPSKFNKGGYFCLVKKAL